MDTDAVIAIVNALTVVSTGELLSVTLRTKLYVFGLSGVPLRTPVLDSVRPVGSEPDRTTQK